MINEISSVTSYQVTTKYYNDVFKTREDAERIDKLMVSLEKIINFAVKEKYIGNILDVEYPFINTKEGTCDFTINGVKTTSETYRYTVNKEAFGRYLLLKLAICKVKNFDLSDGNAKEELERFTEIIDDIVNVFPEKKEMLSRIMRIDNVYDCNGNRLFDFGDTVKNNG